MANTDLSTINQDLARRFVAPLREFYKRRIIFWYDEERQFADHLGELELPRDVELVELTGRNTFAVKKLLCADKPYTNFLVYDPLTFQRDDDNWLINVQLYSEEFRADQNSIWMDEMGLDSKPGIRQIVKYYRKFFGSKDRRAAVAKLSGNIRSTSQMHLAVMSALCGLSDLQPDGILWSVLRAGLDQESNGIYQSFVTYGARDAFWAMTAQATGYQEGENSSLGRLAIHLLLTAASRTMPQSSLAGLDSFISIPHQAYCYDLVSDWLHSEDRRQLYEVARFVEEEARLLARFAKLNIEDLSNTECFPCIDECILSRLMSEICEETIQAEAIQKTVEKRRTMVWYDLVACYYEGLMQVAQMLFFYKEHADGFHIMEPHQIWKLYADDYYRMDSYYRQFHLAFQKSLQKSDPLLDDPFKHVAEKVEGLYVHWFLGQLGQNWSDASADQLAEYGHILEVPQQEEFYRRKVKNSENRVYVIISDALRYEVAVSLAEQLRREMQSKVELESCEALFPTITPFGMAALLPHEELSVQEKADGTLAVLADSCPTEMPNRDQILKAAHPASVALQYKNIIRLKRVDRQALVKGMDIVYCYHDKIDEASHTSDSEVFPACDEAIEEIKNLVRIIVNDFGGTHIYITADHGFLYTYSPLKEDDKVSSASFAEHVVAYGRRFAITQKNAKPDYLMRVKFLGGRTQYEAYAPRENIRIRMKGGGLNYVHGGASLQEMVVPVVEYRHLRSASKIYQRNRGQIDTKPVSVALLSASRKVSNMIFALNFYQTEAVGGNREAATYLVYFTDSNGKQISDINKIIADKTSENRQDRTFRCSFNLRSQEYNSHDSYYLVIADESGLQAPQREEFLIDIAFAVDEFHFFD